MNYVKIVSTFYDDTRTIDGTSYTFDSNDCVLMFKKFRAAYGSNLFGNS